ncbi:MAG: pyridoxamine 5'-phosphate oxidase family protein [Deltaproteobacteria bacterium]|nr:pyridoxamine 5'-phosphate oxidase family protein [Deltaproteobacteria bacterium]
MKYRSVIGFGNAVFIEGSEEKQNAISIIIGQYSESPFQLTENRLKATTVIKVEIESLTGKQSVF